MEKKIDIIIVIVNYNNYLDTIGCIDSILKSVTRLHYAIIVVDNNSTNDSVERIHEYCNDKNITLIQSSENNGYCAGNNIGIKYTLENFDTKYIWILNPDTLVDKFCMQNLFDYAELKNDLGILGCKLIYYPEVEFLQAFGGGNFGIQRSGLLAPSKHIYHLCPSNIALPSEVSLDLIIGASMFIPRRIFETCGLMEESFFLYSDENEFCLRVLQHGYKHYAISNAVVFHKEGWRQKDQKLMTIYYTKRNSLYMTKKLFPRYLKRNLFFSFFSKTLFMYVIKRQWIALRLYLKGVVDFKKGITGKVDLSKYIEV